MDSEEHRVLKFRPRSTGDTVLRGLESEHGAKPKDIERYARDGEPDDFRHRMLTNALAGIFTILLIAGGIWVAFGLADAQRKQDCVFMNRRDCSPPASR